MRKYRQVIVTGILFLSALIFILLINNPKEEEINKILPNVKVMEILTSTDQKQSKFVGIIQPKETYEGTFYSDGTINKVYVVNGQHVKRGTVLMSVSDEDAQENLINAQQAYNIALANQKQAEALMNNEAMNVESEKINNQNSINQAKKDVENLETQLQRARAENADVTQLTIQLESAKVVLNYQESEVPASLTAAQARFNAAVSTFETSSIQTFIALNNVQAAQQQIEQTKLISQIDGSVVMIHQKEGDIATSQMPSVVVASHVKVAVFNLSQSKVNRVSESMVAKIIIENEEYEGLVSAVSFIPDKTSRTYEAKVDVGLNENLNIGETVQVIVDLAESEGTWIDLNLLKNDGQDYVYVIETNRINKRVIERLSLRNNLVLVKNLQKGDLVVVEGFRNLKVGDEVNIVGESNE